MWCVADDWMRFILGLLAQVEKESNFACYVTKNIGDFRDLLENLLEDI